MHNLKPLYTILACCLFLAQSYAQTLYTKDGMPLGDKEEFMSACVNGAEEKLMDFQGLEVKTESYCSCMADKLIPNVTSKEFETAARKNDFSALFTKEENLKVLMDCVESNMSMEDEFEFGEFKDNGLTRDVSVEVCLSEMLADPEITEVISEEQARQYCQCAVDKLFDEGYTYGDLSTIEEEDSEAFNELVLPCLNDALGDMDLGQSNHYEAKDISGPSKSTIEMTELLGTGYNVKLEIGGIAKYYLFDTGASDLVIDEKLVEELRTKGKIDDDSFVGSDVYELADGSLKEAPLILLNDVKIGDFKVNNVVAAVFEEGSMLCGKGLLDKFSNWEFDGASGRLTLYR